MYLDRLGSLLVSNRIHLCRFYTAKAKSHVVIVGVMLSPSMPLSLFIMVSHAPQSCGCEANPLDDQAAVMLVLGMCLGMKPISMIGSMTSLRGTLCYRLGVELCGDGSCIARP